MRTLIRAVLISVAVAYASGAGACPIDLAPCDEMINPSDTSIDTRIDQLILPERSAFRFDDDSLVSITAEVELASAPRQVVLLNHEDDVGAEDHQRTTAIWPDEPDGLLDAINSLVALAAAAEATLVPTRKFLLEDEDLIDIAYTGSVEGPRAPSFAAQPELAIDGYEDR
jgi:hypothetical protein